MVEILAVINGLVSVATLAVIVSIWRDQRNAVPRADALTADVKRLLEQRQADDERRAKIGRMVDAFRESGSGRAALRERLVRRFGDKK